MFAAFRRAAVTTKRCPPSQLLEPRITSQSFWNTSMRGRYRRPAVVASVGGRSRRRKRANPRNRERCRSGGFPGGSKGGGSTPRQSANVLHRVGWLTTSNGRKPAPANAPKRQSGTARNSRDRIVAGKLPGLVVCGRMGDEGEVRSPWRSRRSPTAHRFHPTRTPRGAAIVDLRRS